MKARQLIKQTTLPLTFDEKAEWIKAAIIELGRLADVEDHCVASIDDLGVVHALRDAAVDAPRLRRRVKELEDLLAEKKEKENE